VTNKKPKITNRILQYQKNCGVRYFFACIIVERIEITALSCRKALLFFRDFHYFFLQKKNGNFIKPKGILTFLLITLYFYKNNTLHLPNIAI